MYTSGIQNRVQATEMELKIVVKVFKGLVIVQNENFGKGCNKGFVNIKTEQNINVLKVFLEIKCSKHMQFVQNKIKFG